jgi:ADP-ribose pyrophosphatase
MSKAATKKSVKAGTSHVLKEQLLYSGHWSELIEFSYEDDEKQVRTWEGLHRKHRCAAVIIVAQLKPSRRYILIRQFRPPTDSYILEFPAGLVDPGENHEITATRELLEETGYVGTVEKISPNLFSSPGILSETVSFAHLSVDEMMPENRHPIAKNEPGEFITVFLKYPKEISGFFNEESEKDVLFDVKLYTYFMAQGLL